jgi:phosphatidylglycerophosphate synthase
LTIASASLVLCASALVAIGGPTWASQGLAAVALAVALVLDTSDGHLARLQGTASEFGRWLDANLDELGDMALHAATAWACFVRDGQPGWLLVGMLYAMGKYVYLVGASTGQGLDATTENSGPPSLPRPSSGLRSMAILVGHADVRWHLWIVLAACGRLDVALVVYSLYFPSRAIAGAIRKAARHA